MPQKTLFHAYFTHYRAEAVRIADIALMLLCGIFAFHLRHPDTPLHHMHLLTLACGTLCFALLSPPCHLYRPYRMRRFARQLLPLLMAHGTTLLALLALLFFAHIAGDISRLWIGLWFVTAWGSMALMRLAFAQRSQGNDFAQRLILLGDSDRTQAILHDLQKQSDSIAVRAVYITDAPYEPWFDTSPNTPPIPRSASLAQLAEICRCETIDATLVTSDLEPHPDAAAILSQLELLPCRVQYCLPHSFFGRPLADIGMLGDVSVSAIPVVTIFRAPLRTLDYIIKRSSDIFFSAALLCLFAPLMLAIAALLACEGEGPILFRQLRHGFAGNAFFIFKFRSMRPHAEATTQATRNDARITRMGRLLRRTSLDELPQLFNVLRGDMSLVGPRPHALSHNQHYEKRIARYAMRHRIKPGITGFAQAHGWRGETDTIEKMEKRVEYDLYYIEHWSLWLDIKILLRTAFLCWRHPNAY